MTCKRILVKSNEINSQFTAILYGIVSKFNIDGLSPLVLTKWQVIILYFNYNRQFLNIWNTLCSNLCGMNVESSYLMCLNPECSSNFEMEIESYELESIINIRISITDSTGTLENCILHHQAANKILKEVSNNIWKKKIVWKRYTLVKYILKSIVQQII